MDANISNERQLSDGERLEAITTLARGTPGFLLTRSKSTGDLVFFDALLQCSGDSSFAFTIRHQVSYPLAQRIGHPRTQSTHRWKLGDLKGLSLEDDATELIRQLVTRTKDVRLLEVIKNSALGFHFSTVSQTVFGAVTHHTDDDIRTPYSELSFLLLRPSDLQFWVDGLGHIAQTNDLDMDMVDIDAVEDQLNQICLENKPPCLAASTPSGSSRRRMSKQQWTKEGLAEEENTSTRRTMRKTRFTICPAPIEDEQLQAQKKRQSIYHGGHTTAMQQVGNSANNAILEQKLKETEFEFKTKLEKMEIDFGSELSDLRQRLARSKNESQQYKTEMETLTQNHEIVLSNQAEEYQARIDELEAQYEQDVQDVKVKYSEMVERIQDMNQDSHELREELNTLTNFANEQLNTVRLHNETQLTKLLTDFQMYKAQTQTEMDTLKNITSNLFNDKKKLINALIEAQGNIRVFVRVRPVLPHEIEQSITAGLITNPSSNGSELVCVDVVNQLDLFNSGQQQHAQNEQNKLAAFTGAKDDIQTLLNNSLGAYKVNVKDAEKSGQNNISSEYTFEHVFDHTSTQAQIVQEVLPFVTSVADGYNCCLFAYGQTGSGKTYTMEGTDAEMGVNYTALTSLFELLSKRKEQLSLSGVEHKFNVEVSAVEIYNDDVKDLFTNNLTTVQFIDNKAHLKGLSTRPVSSCEDIRQQLRTKAYVNRTTAATKMNAASSRSHSLIFVNIKSVYTVPNTTPLQTETVTSRLVLIDLAGSERVSRSGVEGKAFNEAVNINKSLSVLGNCLSALQNGDKHTPFRDSKLTMVLADCLTGDSKVLMFANVSPAGINAGETNSTLQFASRAQKTGLGKVSKNTSSTCNGGSSVAAAAAAAAARGATMIGGVPGGGGNKEKKEDDLKIRNLENDKVALQQQLHQQQLQAENRYNSLLQQVEFLQQEKQAIEQKLEKEKSKAAAAAKFSTPTVLPRLSIHSKPTPSKPAKLSIIPPTIIESCDNTDDFVQLPPPTANSPLPTLSHSQSNPPVSKKRRSTEMMIIEETDQVPIHVNKQPRSTVSSAIPSATPTPRPIMSRTVASSATVLAPRSTMSKMVSSTAPAGSSRPTITGSRPLAPTTVANTNRPTISARPTITGMNTAVVKKVSAPTMAGNVPRSTITGATAGVGPRKTVVGASTVKKPIGK
jgi:hypothetical protein